MQAGDTVPYDSDYLGKQSNKYTVLDQAQALDILHNS